MARPKSTKPVKSKRAYIRMTEKREEKIKSLIEKHRLANMTHFLRNAVFYYEEYLKRKEVKNGKFEI